MMNVFVATGFRHLVASLQTIRGQLVLLLLALAIPFLLFLTIVTARQAAHERELAGQQMRGFARVTSARLDDHIGNIEHLLNVISSTVGANLDNVEANNVILREMARHLPEQINNVSLWTLWGENAGSLDPSLRLPGINASARGFFQGAIATPGIAIEAPVPAMSNNKLVGMFAVRIERESRVIGVVMVAAKLTQLQTLLAPPGSLPLGSLITVTDRAGIVLARSLDPEKWIGVRLRENDSEMGGGGVSRDGFLTGRSADGEDRIAGFSAANTVPWRVYVGVPTQVALSAVRTQLGESILVGACMFLIGLGLAMWIGRRIANPLRQLAVDATSFEAGDLAHRITVKVGGEIGILASILNRMAEALYLRKMELEASQADLKKLSEFDALTGLPNRRLFLKHLEFALLQGSSTLGGKALLFMDIDNFKAVNDTFGHRQGDEVLQNFANMIESILGPSNTVARLAGDEFTAIVEVEGPADIQALAAQILEHARRTITLDGVSVGISTSMGIAMLKTGESAGEALHRADEALYQAKRSGRDRAEIFTGDI